MVVTADASAAFGTGEISMADTQGLLEKIQGLPPERISEVEDFVDFLSAKTRREAALDRLFAIAPAIEVAGAPPITEDEILAEVEAARAVRRSQRAGADRS
jgi:hypothetical protein